MFISSCNAFLILDVFQRTQITLSTSFTSVSDIDKKDVPGTMIVQTAASISNLDIATAVCSDVEPRG